MRAISVSLVWRNLILRSALLVGLLPVTFPLRAESPPPETVTLQLSRQHQFQFAGYYAALEKGFYWEAGLEVRLAENNDVATSLPIARLFEKIHPDDRDQVTKCFSCLPRRGIAGIPFPGLIYAHKSG